MRGKERVGRVLFQVRRFVVDTMGYSNVHSSSALSSEDENKLLVFNLLSVTSKGIDLSHFKSCCLKYGVKNRNMVSKAF